MNERELVELLRYVRHDTLNQIQLLQGYLTLGRLEKAQEVLERWVQEAREETKLSNLNCPHLAAFLLTYKWQNYAPLLKFSVIGNGKFSAEQDRNVSFWLKNLIDRLEQKVTEGMENQIEVVIHMQNKPVIHIIWKGEMIQKEDIHDFLSFSESIAVTKMDFAKNYFFLELTI